MISRTRPRQHVGTNFGICRRIISMPAAHGASREAQTPPQVDGTFGNPDHLPSCGLFRKTARAAAQGLLRSGTEASALCWRSCCYRSAEHFPGPCGTAGSIATKGCRRSRVRSDADRLTATASARVTQSSSPASGVLVRPTYADPRVEDAILSPAPWHTNPPRSTRPIHPHTRGLLERDEHSWRTGSEESCGTEVTELLCAFRNC